MSTLTIKAMSSTLTEPISSEERLDVLDILRGFAVFGILLINLPLYGAPVSYMRSDVWPSVPDHIANWLIVFLAQGKFYALFSLLFGLGLAVQMLRTEARGTRFVPLYLRRLTILLVIGLLHTFLLWWGDILHIYALLGFWLLLFRKRQPKTLLAWAGASLMISVLLFVSFGGVAVFRNMRLPIEQRQQNAAARKELRAAETNRAIQTYSEGSYVEMGRQRIKDLQAEYAGLTPYIPHIFAMFLLGLYAGRRGIFRDVTAHLPFIRRVMWVGLAIGLPGNLVFAAFKVELASAVQTFPLNVMVQILYLISASALCLFYASSITLLLQKRSWQERLAPLKAVGRMALSNYLLQTVIGTALFYSYGLGLYGKVGPAICLGLSVTIFLIQIVLSNWWLSRFHFGPVEWLWRSLTYLKPQPARLLGELDLLPGKSVSS